MTGDPSSVRLAVGVDMEDAQLRTAALGGFAVAVAATVATLALAPGIAGSPSLTRDFALNPGLFLVVSALSASALVLVWYRPRNSVGWLLGLSGLTGALCEAGQVYGTRALAVGGSRLPYGELVLSWTAPLWVVSLFVPATLLLARYPSGVLPPGRVARVVDRAVIVSFALLWLGYAGSPVSTTDAVLGSSPPFVLPQVLRDVLFVGSAGALVTGTLLVAVAAVRRMLRAERPERPQLMLLLTASTVSVVVVFLSPSRLLGAAAFALLPLAVAVGVLRYRLLGIELVVRRTLLYGALTGVVLLVFVAVTSGLTAVLPRGPVPQLVAASVVAVVLVPARDRLQRVVDRLLYGDRADPWTAVDRLGRQALDVDPLRAVVAAIGQSLRVPGVEVRYAGGAVDRWGTISPEASLITLVAAGEVLGELAVSPRKGETRLGTADERLLAVLAPLLALVLRSTALAEALQVEQQRVVQATAAERTRLRRDLHDGLGPSLTGIGLGLEAIDGPTVPERSRPVVARLRAEVAACLEEVRRILEDLRPGALESDDLLALLRSRAAHLTATTSVRVAVHAPSALPTLPRDVEAAALRILDEALNNVLRHARATNCSIGVSVSDKVRLEVLDDGVGFAGARPGGVGLPSMQARAAALGGQVAVEATNTGTRLLAELPVEVPA
jgi:signal transduction histidine kinase